ncbi:fimbrial isopeptide formation D2 family protein/LPXTG-motif cell wall-anchored protein [Corynebacterium afermentans]
MSRLTRKSMAIVAAAAFTLSAPLATSPVAVSQEAPAQRINADAETSLTIEKMIGELGSTTAAGDAFTFTAQRVANVDLTTQSGWSAASEISNAYAADPAGYQVPVEGETYTATTDSTGKAAFNSTNNNMLPVGMYLVTEETTGNFSEIAPFLITVPNIETDSTVNYNPTVKPKNQEINPTKAHVDTDVRQGEDIEYTINAPVPLGDRTAAEQDENPNLNQLREFKITDVLPEGLAPKAPTKVSAPGVELVSGTDYTATVDGRTLTVEFTDAGRKKLFDARTNNANLAVTVKFPATVNAIPADGRVLNQAQLKIANRDSEILTSVAEGSRSDGSEEPDKNLTEFADVTITKTVDGEAKSGGAGAQFEVVACDADGNQVGDTAVQFSQGEVGQGDRVITAQGGTDTAAATATGIGFVTQEDTDYCVREIKAAEGYLLNPDLIKLERMNAANGRVEYTATVDNVKNNIFGRLPATGERTMLYILALGLVLFGGGAAYQLSRRNA